MSVGFTKYQERGAYHFKGYYEEKNWYKTLVDKVLSYFPNEGTVLDMGCGEGLTVKLLKEKGLEVDGFDAEEKAVALAKEKGIDIECKEIKDVRLDKDYDYMLSLDFIEHIENPEQIAELLKHCKNYMILTTDRPHMRLRRFDHYRYNIKQLREIFKDYKVEFLFHTKDSYAVKISKQ